MSVAEKIVDNMESSEDKPQPHTGKDSVLIIPPSRIGDAILASGVINAVIEKYDNPSVTVAAPKLIHDLFLDIPNLNKVIPFEKKKFSMHWPQLWVRCLGKKWSHVLDLRGSAMTFFLMADNRTVWRKGNPVDHKVKQVSSLLGKEVRNPTLWMSDERMAFAKKILNGKKTFVVSPAANWLGKQWPAENFCEIVKRLHEKDPQAQFLVVSAPHERQMIESVAKVAPANTLDFTNGDLDLLTLAAVIKQSTLFLGNDSGLMHMSAAVGTPTIGLFGPTNDQNYGPWNNTPRQNYVVRTPESRPQILKRKDFSFKSRDMCYMHSLTVDKVWKTVEKAWF